MTWRPLYVPQTEHAVCGSLGDLHCGHSAVATTVGTTRPAVQARCSSGAPAFAYRGYCATFDAHTTYYGLYGLGFPTASGWGICSERPASGGAYPRPGYGYVRTGAPTEPSSMPALWSSLPLTAEIRWP